MNQIRFFLKKSYGYSSSSTLSAGIVAARSKKILFGSLLLGATAITLTSLSLAKQYPTYNDSCTPPSPTPSLSQSQSPSSTLSIEFKHELENALAPDQIDYDENELKLHGKPYNSYHSIARSPDVVVYPQSTKDVSAIVGICSRYNVPIVPYGGATSIEGQLLAYEGGVSIDFSHMKRIVAFNRDDLDITVEAGLGYIELNEMLRPHGLWFPLDPGPGASIGGMCSCRCSGSTAVRYGSMRENVLNIVAVIPDKDGTVIKTGSRARKSSAGYDLTRLLIGSEGTLAVITEVTLKIHAIPKVSYAMKISFPSIKHAALTASSTLNCGITIGRCELMDDKMIDVINQTNPSSVPWVSSTTLLYEITGHSHDSVIEQIEIVKKIAAEHDAISIEVANDDEANVKLWRLRKEALWSIMSAYPDREPMITDVCVPLTHLSELITQTREEIDKTSLPCPIVAHAGDGNFHVIIMFKPDEVSIAKELANNMAVRAIALGGTCTGEHGVGVGKIDLLELEMGAGSMGVMRSIKQAIDPKLILNPGKVMRIDWKTGTGGCH